LRTISIFFYNGFKVLDNPLESLHDISGGDPRQAVCSRAIFSRSLETGHAIERRLYDLDRASPRPPAQGIGRSEDHDTGKLRPGRKVARAGIIADIGRGGSEQGQQFDAAVRAVNGGFAARKSRQQVLFGRTDHELRAQPEVPKLPGDIPKTRKRPAFAPAAGAGVDEDGL
jgi:hypothetical protein